LVGRPFYIDLLLFNRARSRPVVLELKIGRFQPQHTGKLGCYAAWGGLRRDVFLA